MLSNVEPKPDVLNSSTGGGEGDLPLKNIKYVIIHPIINANINVHTLKHINSPSFF